jgi:hypothetical protein
VANFKAELRAVTIPSSFWSEADSRYRSIREKMIAVETERASSFIKGLLKDFNLWVLRI